jgi:hypothetical protein
MKTRSRSGSYSVGPELTQERAIFHACCRQNPSVAETPPKADHHRGPTHVARRPKISTKGARQGKGTEQALPMIARESLPSQPSESLVLWAPRRCLQEEHDTGVPPPPDPRILGFHPEEVEGRRLASRRLQQGSAVRGRRHRGPRGKGFPLAKSPPSTPRNTQLADHHAALTAVVTGQHQSHWLARQPT